MNESNNNLKSKPVLEDLVPQHSVRLMTVQDVDQALDIWRETGMFQPVSSLNTWMKVDPHGLFVAATPEGHILGTGGTIISKNDLAVFGLYGVREIYRGKGVGGKILQAALSRLQGLNCALNTAESHLSTYRDRAGFKLQTGWVALASVRKSEGLLQDCHGLLRNESVSFRSISGERTKAVVQYDETVHGFNRDKIITLTLQEPDCQSLVAVGNKDGKVKGYGMIRKDVHGYGTIGPLYADDAATAEALTFHLVEGCHWAKDTGLVFTGLRENPGSVAIIEKLNMTVDDEFERLFTKEIVPIPDMNKVYSLYDLNFCNF